MAAFAATGVVSLLAGFIVMGTAGTAQADPKPKEGDVEYPGVEICHATGSDWVYNGPATGGSIAGHLGDKHQDGRDVIPSFEYREYTNDAWVTKVFPGQNADLVDFIGPNGCNARTSVVDVSPVLSADNPCGTADDEVVVAIGGVVYEPGNTTYPFTVSGSSTEGFTVTFEAEEGVNYVNGPDYELEANQFPVEECEGADEVDVRLEFVPDCDAATNQWRVTNHSDQAVTVWYGDVALELGAASSSGSSKTFTTSQEDDEVTVTWGDGESIAEGSTSAEAGADLPPGQCRRAVAITVSFVADCSAENQWSVSNPSESAVTVTTPDGDKNVPANGSVTFLTPSDVDDVSVTWGGPGTHLLKGSDDATAGADSSNCGGGNTGGGGSTSIAVTPEITYVDQCGTANDRVDGVAKSGYTFVVDKAKGSVTFTAASGYYLTAGPTLTAPLTDVPCPSNVTAVAPTVAQSESCGVEGSYTIPSTTGVQYLLDGRPVQPGTYEGPVTGTVTAQALGDTVLTDPTFSYALDVAAAGVCPVVAPVEEKDVCPNVTGSQSEVPAGYSREGGRCVKSTVKGVESEKPRPEAVPTAVDAGFGPVATTPQGSPLGQGLVGGGLLMLLLAGSMLMGRRERGAHEI